MDATSAFDGFDRAEGSHHRQVRAPRSIAGGLAEEPGFWAWRLEAACGGLPSSVFFSPDGERGAARRRRERAARLVCAGCRVRERCAVWGGLSEHERAMIWDRQGGTAT